MRRRWGQNTVYIVTDKLRSYIKPITHQASGADHRAHKGLNNRIEGSHRPTRWREKIMGRFKSPRANNLAMPTTMLTNTAVAAAQKRWVRMAVLRLVRTIL